MKTLFFGAGPLGSVYAHLLFKNGEDVTILARGERYPCLSLPVFQELTSKTSVDTPNLDMLRNYII